MAFTIEQLDALDEAIASGALTVKYNGKEVTYRSMSELMRTREFVSKKLGLKETGLNQVYLTASKGLSGE